MKRRLALLALIATACGTSCAHIAPTPGPSDATCASVCARGAELGCRWATPTPGGATCYEVCDNADKQGEPWQLTCLAKAMTCDQACP